MFAMRFLSGVAERCQTPVMAKPEIDINKLTPEERLDLIEELWDSLRGDPEKIPLTDAQAKELDRRVAFNGTIR